MSTTRKTCSFTDCYFKNKKTKSLATADIINEQNIHYLFGLTWEENFVF